MLADSYFSTSSQKLNELAREYGEPTSMARAGIGPPALAVPTGLIRNDIV